jgi:DtxR family Mn-dependent transcriptional regulator
LFCAVLSTTRATEDYLKAVYGLATRGSGDPVTTGALAHQLGLSSPSVSAMTKRLEREHLLERPGPRGVRLTAQGERAALRVVRRHRLLETFLVRVLDVPWDEVHAEAELLEHALSDRLEERIDNALGHPTRDPHGDPIPSRDGSHDEDWGECLGDAPAGGRFRVERVSDRDSEALRYLGVLGVVPGAVLEVDEQSPFEGPQWVRIRGERHALGAPLTRLVHGRTER